MHPLKLKTSPYLVSHCKLSRVEDALQHWYQCLPVDIFGEETQLNCIFNKATDVSLHQVDDSHGHGAGVTHRHLGHQAKVNDGQLSILGDQQVAWMRICMEQTCLKELC